MAANSETHSEVVKVLNVLDDEETDSRTGGCVALVDHKLYFWGGESSERVDLLELSDEDVDGEDSHMEKKQTLISITLPRPNDKNHPFEVFDLKTLTWSQKYTSGEHGDSDVPNVGTGSSLIYYKPTNSLYLFGGFNKFDFSSALFCISMSTDIWVWEKVIPNGKISPVPCYLTGVLLHEDVLCVFGGVCRDPGELYYDEGSSYDSATTDNVVLDYGWTNQYFEFDLQSSEKIWLAPMRGSKDRPIPIGAHVFVKIDKCRALCFGGRTRKGRTNNAFIFNLDCKQFDGPINFDVKPPARSFTTLVPLVDPHKVGTMLYPAMPPLKQKLLLLWGKSFESEILSDCWIFDCEENKWTQVELKEEGRSWQSGCVYYPEPDKSSECQVIVYGGNTLRPGKVAEYYDNKGLTILSYGVKTLRKLSLLAVISWLLQHYRNISILPSEEELLHELEGIPPFLRNLIFETLMIHSHFK